MVMGSRMQHGSAQPTAAHALQGKRNARVVGCDEDNAQPAAAYALQRYEILLIDPMMLVLVPSDMISILPKKMTSVLLLDRVSCWNTCSSR